MLKKFFWESVSPCLFMVLGVCMMSVSVQPRLFAKCAGHDYCSETTLGNACVYDAKTEKCKDSGCHRQNNESQCDTCVCKEKNNDKECFCE